MRNGWPSGRNDIHWRRKIWKQQKDASSGLKMTE